jgi:PAS domain S-box-containing protein
MLWNSMFGRFVVRWLIALFAGALIAALLVAAVLQAKGEGERASAQAYDRALGLAASAVADLDRILGAADVAIGAVIEHLADDPALIDRDRRALQQFLVRMHARVPEARSIGVLGADGALLADSFAYPSPPINLADRRHFRALRDEPGAGLVVDGPVSSRRAEDPDAALLVMNRSRLTADGRFGGAVLATITAATLRDRFRAILGSAEVTGSAILLVRLDGALVARSNSERAPNALNLPEAHPLTQGIAGEAEGRVSAPDPFDGADSFFVFRRVHSLPFAVVVELPQAELAGAARGDVSSAALMIFGVLIVAAVAWWLMRAFSKTATMADQLRESEQRLRDFASATSDWLVETDHEDRITYISDRRRDGADDSRSSIGRQRGELIDPSYNQEAWRQHLDDIAKRQPYRDVLIRRRRPDGSAVYMRLSGMPVHDAHGRFTGYRGTTTDVTALIEAEHTRQRMEGQLQQHQKLESLGTLAGGIAHDFNNSLVPILTLTQLSLKEAAGGSKLHRNLTTVLTAARHSREIVRKILAFSRREDGAMGAIDLRTSVAEGVTLAKLGVPPYIHVRQSYDERAIPLQGDHSQIVQIVTNLIHNAVQAIATHGEIAVAVAVAGEDERRKHAADLPAGRVAMLRVSDSGCGMDAGTLKRIYEPFFTTKPVGSGTGLGLAMVHGIVVRHGGQIAVMSEPGRGTTFTIYFPVREAALEAA